MKKFAVGVLGATGLVGQEMLRTLVERNFPTSEIFAIASSKSEGQNIDIEDLDIKVHSIDNFDTSKLDILLASAGAEVSAKYLPNIAKKGTVVIDNSSYFRTDPDIPLIIPEVNLLSLEQYKNKNIIANPNCSTIQMLVAVAPLHKHNPIKTIIVSTYQSVSGAGKDAMDELFNQTKDVYNNVPLVNNQKVFTKQIAFNCIPHIDKFLDNGYTKEEWKMDFETKKILDPSIQVSATCVRVPVFVAHAMAITVQFSKPIEIKKVIAILKQSQGISVINYNQDEGYATSAEVAGEDNIFISRIRKDTALENALTFWVVADNLRKGAALNAVQIAEKLIDIM